MKTQAGLWIDHRKAVVVTVSDEGSATMLLESHVARHARNTVSALIGFSRESPPFTGEDTQDRHFQGHLSKYYDDVIACIGDAEAILIFGPGEAKGELRSRLENRGRGAHIVGVETVDKMTDPQIVAKVRERLTT